MLQAYNSDKLPTPDDLNGLAALLEMVLVELGDFERAKEDAILFGAHKDMLDIQRGTQGMRVVPTTKE